MASPPYTPRSQPTPGHAPAAITAREAAILPHILLCTREPSRLQFDWDKLAQRMGMKNPRSAANSWLAVRKKIEAISSAAASANPPPRLTQHDHRFLANAVSCTKRPLDVDYSVLASKLGMTNPRSASNAWAAIRKKIAAGSESATSNGVSVTRAAEKGNGKGRSTVSSTTRRHVAKEERRVQSAETPATLQPLPFKVVKREVELCADEKKPSAHDFAEQVQGSDGYGLSISQPLSMRHVHMMALAPDEADEDRVRVKDEPFDEC